MYIFHKLGIEIIFSKFFGRSNIMYIFHIIEKTSNNAMYIFHICEKNVKKFKRGEGGCQITYIAKLPINSLFGWDMK